MVKNPPSSIRVTLLNLVRVPPNLSFVIDDIEEPWTFTKKFDFIHARMMVGSFASWETFLEQSMRYPISLSFATTSP